MVLGAGRRGSGRRGIAPVLLEDWLRDYYFETTADLGSSGVQVFTVAELRALIGLDLEEIEAVRLDDTPSLGTPALRRAIAERWAGGDVSQVMVTHGSSEAIYLLTHALLQPGDDVVAVDPRYQQLASVAEAVGAHVRPWRLRFSRGFAPDIDELASLIRPDTRLVVVNFPHNPTGVTLTSEQQAALVAHVERAGAYLLWDGAFTDLSYDRPPLPDPRRRSDRAISIGTLSKAYGLPGLRVGWCLAPPDILARMVRLRDYITLNLSPLVEQIATRVVRAADRVVAARLHQARTNRDTLTAWMDRMSPLVEWVRPDGGVCAFPRMTAVADVDALCHRLAREDRVLLVPGSCFGRPAHVRLGFGRSAPDFARGLARLATLLETEQTGVSRVCSKSR